MKRQFVSSSNLYSVGYEPKTETLEIEFRGGDVYQYYNVSGNIYDHLMKAGSKGEFFHVYIRYGYPNSRVG